MLIASSFSFAACTANKEKQHSGVNKKVWLKPDSAVYSQLGKNLSTILFSGSKVECYSLKYVEQVKEKDFEVESNLVRDSLLATLNDSQKDVLRFIMFMPLESYQNDSLRVRAPYSPILEFDFYHKKMKQHAHVVISLNDMTWTVVYDDKKQFNYNYANKAAVARFCEYFLSL